MKDSPVRLIYVLEQTQPSNQLYGLFDFFVRNGIEITVFNFDSNMEFKEQLSDLTLDYHCLPFGASYWKGVSYLQRLVRQVSPHVIHANEFIPAFYTGFLPKRNGLKTIYHRRHNYTPKGKVQLMDQWAVMRSDRVVAVCETMRKVAQGEHPFYKKKILARTNAITIGLKHGVTYDAEKAIIDQLPNKFTILLLARLRPGKGHSIATIVLKELIDLKYDVQLIFVGDGPDYDSIKSMVSESGVEEHTHLLGNFENVELAVRKADVMLVPSEMEAFPKTPLEGMAYGCPVIAHSVGGIVEAIEDGVNGFLVEPGNVQEFVEKVQLILNDDKLRKGIETKGEETVRKRYVVEIMVREMIELYKDLIKDTIK